MIIPVWVTARFWIEDKNLNRLECPWQGEGRLEMLQNVLPCTTWICKLCSLLQLEHIQAFGAKALTGRMRGTDWNTETLREGWHFGWNLGNKREVWCFLIAEDASVSTPTRNTLCYKQQTHMWVLELVWREQNVMNSSLFIVLAGESEGIPFYETGGYC